MKLHATGRDLLIKESERLISGSIKIYECEFTFDESWDGYTVTAVFSTNGSRLINMAVVDGKCEIPSEVLRPNARIRVGVFGIDGDRRRPTTYSDWITVEQGVDLGGGSAQPPTPSVYEQWLRGLDEKQDEWNANEEARAEAEAARVEAENARVEAEEAREAQETGYVAQAESWAREAEDQAKDAKAWADKAQEVVGGDYATKAQARAYANTAESKANTYTDEQIAAIPTPDVSGQIGKHNTSETAHADIREEIGNVTIAVSTAQSTADRAASAAETAQATADEASDAVGDIKTTLRTDLGDKWLLCNGAMINGSKYPALAAICEDTENKKTGDHFNKGAIEFADGVFVAACVNSSNYLEIHAFEHNPDSGAVVYKDSSATVYSLMNVMVVHNDKDGMWYVFACSSSDKFRVYATDDPLSGNWTKTNPAYHNLEFGFAKACCYNGTFVILGEVGDLPTVLVSTNPTESWTANTVATFKVDNGGVCCHNGTWVLALSETKDYDSYIMATTDPLGTWTANNISGVSFGFHDICCHDGVFAAVDGYRGDVHYATDPLGTWTKSEVAQELKEAKRIKWLNGYWVIAERVNFSPSEPAFAYTSDLNSAWVYTELDTVGSGHSCDVAYGNGVWVAVCDMHSTSYTAGGFVYKGKALPAITTDGAYTYIRAKE